MFVIKDQNDFARKLLPLYYKHNNMASFIRQLNMYGFHKVVSVDNGSLKCDNEEIQFSHPCFLRGHPYLLKHIKRKIANPKSEEKSLLKPELMTKMLSDVKQMRGRQESLDARFSIMKHENEALWREVAVLRQKHSKQQQIVNNLIQFLMSLVQNSRNGPLKTGAKRGYQLMINDSAHNIGREDGIRNAKNPHYDSDLDQEEDLEFMDNELPEDDGPTILEVKDQNAGSPMLNPASNPKVDHFVTSPMSAPSPSTSIPESFTVPSEIDEIASHSLLFDIPLMDDVASPSQIPSQSQSANENAEPENFPYKSKRKNQKGTSGKKSSDDYMSQSSPAFTITSTQAPATLPINIFDDENYSQDGSEISLSEVNRQAALSSVQQTKDDLLDNVVEMSDFDFSFGDSDRNSKDSKANSKPKKNNARKSSKSLVDNISLGSYNENININAANSGGARGKKSNRAEFNKGVENVKEELADLDSDSVNKVLVAAPPNENKRPVLGRFNSVEDVDDHLLSMQNDIESLRGLILGGETYSLDANTLLGLFGQEEPFYGLSVPNSSDVLEKTKDVADESNQLISYVPPGSGLSLEDFTFDDDTVPLPAEDNQTAAIEDSTLNTPQVQLLEPKFPNDNNF